MAMSALAALLFLPACVPPGPENDNAMVQSMPRYATYRCDGDSEITLENFRTSVHVVDTRGVDIELPAAPPNQTSRYGEPGYALILEKSNALWMVSGKHPVNCKREGGPA
jgi:CRISPR/Cas system-associated exonuclease Cas4 (RecB family)